MRKISSIITSLIVLCLSLVALGGTAFANQGPTGALQKPEQQREQHKFQKMADAVCNDRVPGPFWHKHQDKHHGRNQPAKVSKKAPRQAEHQAAVQQQLKAGLAQLQTARAQLKASLCGTASLSDEQIKAAFQTFKETVKKIHQDTKKGIKAVRSTFKPEPQEQSELED